MATTPEQYVVMEYHQNLGANLSGSPEWRPDSWWRDEFRESENARQARAVLEQWLVDCPLALGHVMYLLQAFARPAGRAADRPDTALDLRGSEAVTGIRLISRWLDDLLYGQGKSQFPKEERYAIQTTADSMARADFCRMDFRALAASAVEADIPARPISAARAGKPV